MLFKCNQRWGRGDL